MYRQSNVFLEHHSHIHITTLWFVNVIEKFCISIQSYFAFDLPRNFWVCFSFQQVLKLLSQKELGMICYTYIIIEQKEYIWVDRSLNRGKSSQKKELWNLNPKVYFQYRYCSRARSFARQLAFCPGPTVLKSKNVRI